MKKIVIVLVFVAAIATLNACKTTSSCTSVEKQDINDTKTEVTVATDVAT